MRHSYLAAVVHEASNAALSGGVHNVVLIKSEQVAAAHTELDISLLTFVSDHLSHDFADVLNDHGVGWNGLSGKQAPVMNLRACKPQALSKKFQLVEFERTSLYNSPNIICESALL
jgi:hypothetical protein